MEITYKTIKTIYNVNLTEVEEEALYDLVDTYCTSFPISSSWETEAEHEIKAISKLFNTNEEITKFIMVQYLGFDYSELN